MTKPGRNPYSPKAVQTAGRDLPMDAAEDTMTMQLEHTDARRNPVGALTLAGSPRVCSLPSSV